jgi:hypothetical protein
VGKSAYGPDMRDCLAYLLQMDKQGGWFTTVLLLPGGSATAPSVTFNLMSVRQEAEVPEGIGVMTVYDGFPSREHSTFSGAFYRAVVEHDKRLSGVPLLGPEALPF